MIIFFFSVETYCAITPRCNYSQVSASKPEQYFRFALVILYTASPYIYVVCMFSNNIIHSTQPETRTSGGKTNCSMPLVCDTYTHIYGWNVKCIRKLENTKTLGTNEQYYVYRALYAYRFLENKKKLLVMKCRRKT